MSRLVLVAALIGLGACASTEAPSSANAFRSNIDLVSVSYSAAETLINQPGAAAIRTDAPILIASLANVDEIDTSSSFGRIVSDQISSRLAQMGYSVAEARLRGSMSVNRQGEFMLSRDARQLLQQQYNAQAVVTGTYAVGAYSVYVSLRLVRLSDAKVVAAFDYNIPKGLDLRELTKPTPSRPTEAAAGGIVIR